MPLERDSHGRTYILHPSGQRTHYILDSFTDPWKPCETILIQHGFGRHSAFWYHWIPILSRQYRVIRRDLRGHGYSSYPTPPTPSSSSSPSSEQKSNYTYTLDTILDEILDTLDQLGVNKVHFLGESTSGILGEIFASKHPDRLHTLTICASPTHLPPAALQLFAFNHPDWPTACRVLGSRGWAEALARIPGTIPISDPEYLPWYLEQIGISEGEGLAQYAEFLSTLDARLWLGGIRVPMLVLAPTESAAVKVQDMKDLAEVVQECNVEFVEGGGHEIYVTRAEECQRVFLEFVGGLR